MADRVGDDVRDVLVDELGAQSATIPGVAHSVQRAGEPATGVVVLAGPAARLTLQRMKQFGPPLLEAMRTSAREFMPMVNAPVVTATAEVVQVGSSEGCYADV